MPLDISQDIRQSYELEAVDRASAQLILIRIFQCKLMVGDVSHRGVKAGEVSAYFRMRHRARPIQGNLINWTVKETVTEKSKL